LRTVRGRAPVTGRDPFSGLVYADLADSVRSGVPGRRPSASCGHGRGQGPRRDNQARPALAARRV